MLNAEGNQVTPQTDYLKVRVFLYKYTPPFTLLPSPSTEKPSKSEATNAVNPATQTSASQSAAASALFQPAPTLTSLQNTINGLLGQLTTLVGTLSGQGTSPLSSAQVSQYTLIFRNSISTPPSFVVYQTNNPNGKAAQEALDQQAIALRSLFGAPSFPNVAIANLTQLQSYLTTLLNRISKGLVVQQKAASSKTQAANTEAATHSYEKNLLINRFSCPFNATYFSRFEISSFLKSYTVTQSMKDMGNSLEIEFLNDIVSYADLEVPAQGSSQPQGAIAKAAAEAKAAFLGSPSPRGIRRPIWYPSKPTTSPTAGDVYTDQANPEVHNSSLSGDELITNISQYFTETATDFSTDSIRAETAIRLRGVKNPDRKTTLQQEIMTAAVNGFQDVAFLRRLFKVDGSSNDSNDSGADGILLSDLIQKFDMISVVIYKWPYPPNLLESFITKTAPQLFDTEPMMFACPTSFLPSIPNTSSTSPKGTSTIPLYESEFLGFVSNISFSTSPGQFSPNVKIGAKSVTNLLASSRRVYASTALQKGIYEVGELPNIKDLSIFQNTLQSFKKDSGGNSRTTTPVDILKVLLREFYHIKFIGATQFNVVTNILSTPSCYIDLREMEYNNNVIGATDISTPIPQNAGDNVPVIAPAASGSTTRGSTNFLSIPSYLYGLVMQLRKFNVHITGESSPRFYTINTDAVGGSPLVINKNLFATEVFTPYFVRLSDTFGGYNPVNKTPLEILEEVCKLSYLEFFETPGGRLVFRTPQYNNVTKITTGISIDSDGNALMVDSSQVIPIGFNYTDTKDNLLSGIQMSTAVHILSQDIPLIFPRYVNGKMLDQYGFMIPQPFSNPNALPRNTTNIDSNTKGIFKYCNFFYEYNNALLKNGSISYVGTNLIQIGQTFYDITYQKFGYVTSIAKRLEVGGSYVATASLSMVRNASPIFDPVTTSSVPNPSVYLLPTLEALAESFGGTATPTNADPIATSRSISNRTESLAKLAAATRDIGFAKLVMAPKF